MQYGKEKKKIFYITVYYKPRQNKKEIVKILDENFIKINGSKCKIIYNNKIYELK